MSANMNPEDRIAAIDERLKKIANEVAEIRAGEASPSVLTSDGEFSHENWLVEEHHQLAEERHQLLLIVTGDGSVNYGD